MKKLVLFTFLALTNYSFSQYDYENQRILSPWYEFEEGSTELLYGDAVVLRKKPSKNARALDTLSIAAEVTIMEKSNTTVVVNGRESNWYKVKTEKGVGYIAGGLIALDSREVNGGTYLVIVAEANEALKFRVRYVKNGNFYGKEGDLSTSSFALQVHGSRGVEGIEDMAVIDLFAEACGVDGGYTYVFNDGKRLINAIHCSSVGDGGFWFSEELTFPEDRGWGSHVDYEREVGEPMNEEMNWSRSVTDQVVLEWKNDRFEPNISEMDFK